MISEHQMLTAATFLLLYFTVSLAISDDECRMFLASEPEAINSSFTGKMKHGQFMRFVTNDRHYELENVVKFEVLTTVYENKDKAALCVGIVDTTSYTRNKKSNNSNAIAWATLNTKSDIPTGVVMVDGECWTLKREISDCNPQYFPMPGIMDTPIYRYSPLSPEFWPLLQDDHLFTRTWVWRMNTMSREEEKLPSSWVSNIMMRSLRDLQVVGNDWRHPEVLLSPLPNLEVLDIPQNNIQELPEDLLLNTPNLRVLILARNNLSVFPKNLNRLPNLRLLDITNPWGDAQLTISDSDLSGLNRVEIIGLENINLNTNVTNLLQLQNLKFLNLSGCRIDNIDDINPKEITNGEKPLGILDLSNNNLVNLPSTLFSSLTKLKTLYLHRNKLDNCPEESLKYLTNLEHLTLFNNHLTRIERYCFQNLGKNLKHLDLSRNNINFIDEDVFSSVNSLTSLQLAGNELTILSPFTFSTPNNVIQTLDLSHNNLSKWIESSHFNFLNLSHNAFIYCTGEDLEAFNNVSVLDLGGNSFSCCDGNLSLFRNWLKETNTDVKNLGRKDLLECVIPGENQRYPIRNFVYEEELCDLVIGVNPNNVLIIAMASIIVVMLIVIIVLAGIFYHYRDRLAIKKFISLP